MRLISSLAWVAQGIAAEKPTKVRLDREELRALLGATAPVSTATETSDADAEDPAQSKQAKLEEDEGSSEEDSKEADEVEDRYGLGSYDKEAGEGTTAMGGIAVYASNADDPHLQSGGGEEEDSSDDSSEEGEAWRILPSDNLLLLAKVDRDEFTLQVHVHNGGQGDLYSHHFYQLPAPPIAVCPINFDPLNPDKGNMAAVGTFEPEVGVWDLDMLESVEPAIALGQKLETRSIVKNGKRKLKKTRTGLGHTDAVTSLAWSSLTPHVLASGSADEAILLWDLEAEAASTRLAASAEERAGKVLALQWHPDEAAMLLSGTRCVQLWDGRKEEAVLAVHTKGEAEACLWDVSSPFNFLSADASGSVAYWDSRSAKKSLWSEPDVSSGSFGAVTLLGGELGRALVTAGEEEEALALWKMTATGLELVGQTTPKVGNIHALHGCPEDAWTLAVGGSAGDFYRILDLRKIVGAKEAFDGNVKKEEV